MNTELPRGDARSALMSIRRYVQPRTVREECELCGEPLADEHAHVIELANRLLRCACDACAILFSNQAAAKFRRVPRRTDYLADFHLTDLQWEGLQLPINLAFLLHISAAGRVVAFYPSPAGATEARPPLDAWQMVVEDNPVLRELEPDVEALLVNRLGATPEYYRVGIDECYKLVGLIRTHWRGMSGGPEVWERVRGFFTGLNERCRRGDAVHA